MMNVTVTVKGGAGRKFSAEMLRAVQDEIVVKVSERWMRTPKRKAGLGIKNNVLTARTVPLEAAVSSTLIWPRTKGTSWAGYQIATAKAMLRNVIRKAVRRIMDEWQK